MIGDVHVYLKNVGSLASKAKSLCLIGQGKSKSSL